jgi:hypothetical protein
VGDLGKWVVKWREVVSATADGLAATIMEGCRAERMTFGSNPEDNGYSAFLARSAGDGADQGGRSRMSFFSWERRD